MRDGSVASTDHADNAALANGWFFIRHSRSAPAKIAAIAKAATSRTLLTRLSRLPPRIVGLTARGGDPGVSSELPLPWNAGMCLQLKRHERTEIPPERRLS